MLKDKKLHLLAGLALSLLAGLFVCPSFGLAVAVVAGLGKDVVWDRWLKRGTFEWLDIWATVTGGALGAVILRAARWCRWNLNKG